jgi:hypothetical protein
LALLIVGFVLVRLQVQTRFPQDPIRQKGNEFIRLQLDPALLDRAQRLRQAARLSNADEPVNRFEARPAGAAATGARR